MTTPTSVQVEIEIEIEIEVGVGVGYFCYLSCGCDIFRDSGERVKAQSLTSMASRAKVVKRVCMRRPAGLTQGTGWQNRPGACLVSSAYVSGGDNVSLHHVISRKEIVID